MEFHMGFRYIRVCAINSSSGDEGGVHRGSASTVHNLLHGGGNGGDPGLGADGSDSFFCGFQVLRAQLPALLDVALPLGGVAGLHGGEVFFEREFAVDPGGSQNGDILVKIASSSGERHPGRMRVIQILGEASPLSISALVGAAVNVFGFAKRERRRARCSVHPAVEGGEQVMRTSVLGVFAETVAL